MMRALAPNFQEGLAAIAGQVRELRALLAALEAPLLRHLEGLGPVALETSFQMLLLLFRRELAWDDTFTFWEALWAGEALARAPLRVHAVAALFSARRRELLQLESLDDLVMWVNGESTGGGRRGGAGSAMQRLCRAAAQRRPAGGTRACKRPTQPTACARNSCALPPRRRRQRPRAAARPIGARGRRPSDVGIPADPPARRARGRRVRLRAAAGLRHGPARRRRHGRGRRRRRGCRRRERRRAGAAAARGGVTRCRALPGGRACRRGGTGAAAGP
jgi:hypothetical protein